MIMSVCQFVCLCIGVDEFQLNFVTFRYTFIGLSYPCRFVSVVACWRGWVVPCDVDYMVIKLVIKLYWS